MEYFFYIIDLNTTFVELDTFNTDYILNFESLKTYKNEYRKSLVYNRSLERFRLTFRAGIIEAGLSGSCDFKK
jgi:hypothetical protein